MDILKLMIADEHLIVREGLKCLLESDNNFKVIAEAKDDIECLDKIWKYEPDLLIVEPNIRNKNGWNIIKDVNIGNVRKVKILILTGCEDKECYEKAKKLGVDAYLLKSIGIEELKKAILLVMQGNVYYQENLEFILLDCKRVSDAGEIDSININKLTKREMDVLENLAVGMYNKEIAIKLEISERTVKNHVSNIFKKVGVADRTQAAVFAIRNGLVKI